MFKKLTRKIQLRMLRYANQELSIKSIRDSSSLVRLNIGSGNTSIPGYINIDARNLPNVHVISDKLTLDDFKDETVSEIYLCHVLEHISHLNIGSILSHYYEKLCPGGMLRLSVPDFQAIIHIYQDSGGDISAIELPLMGGQDYGYNFHKSIYDESYLTGKLQLTGFRDIKSWLTEEDFGGSIGDWSDLKIECNGKKYRISLNLKARK